MFIGYVSKATMSSNNENLHNKNDQPSSNDDTGGNVLAPRTNLPSLNTDQPYKPVTASAGGTIQTDSGYRTASTSVTTPAFTTSVPPALATAVPATPTSVLPLTLQSPSGNPPLTIARGRHARSDAQDLGTPVSQQKSSAKLGSIDEKQPTSSTIAHENDGKSAQYWRRLLQLAN